MRKNLVLALAMFASLSIWAQNTVKGVVKIGGTSEPAVGAVVTLQGQKASAVTNAKGEFVIQATKAGDEVLTILQEGYDVTSRSIAISNLAPLDLGEVVLVSKEAEVKADLTEEMFLATSDIEFDDEDGLSSQSISGVLYSRGDVFSGAASYSFSPVRYRLRGYAQSYESTYINGVNFNDQERGRFNYSSLGGLNDASRNKEIVANYTPNNYTYGNVGNSTNIDMRASTFAKGTKLGLAGTNRSYWLRAHATYATGIMDNGWALAGSMAYRWSQEGIQEGTFYNSGAYFLSAEKIFNPRHSLSIVTFGAPTERAGSSALTQETVDLTSIYYNPYWGYQNGKKRNSRVVHSYDPTAIVSHDWKISETQRLRTGLGVHYSMYSNSALTFYNASDPRPDYYRNLPSYQTDGKWRYDAGLGQYVADMSTTNMELYNEITDMWKSGNVSTTQIDWDALYRANYANNAINGDNPLSMAKYMVERRHNNLLEGALNSVYKETFNDEQLTFVAGFDAKYTRGIHYKTVDDLLGANQWVDIDPFSDRDIADLAENVGLTQSEIANVRQNDVNNPDKVVKEGDVFGYKYDINVYKASAFAHNEWDFNHWQFYYGLKATYSLFNRYGYMENGRAVYLSNLLSMQTGTPVKIISKGHGVNHSFVDPSIKAGATYNFNGHNRLAANVMAETRAPLASSYYVSQRISDRSVDVFYNKTGNALTDYYGTSEKVLAYDLSYIATYPRVRARLSLYRTQTLDGIEQNGYYNDEYRTFINQVMIGVDKVYQGAELGASVKLNTSFTLSGVLALNDAHYTDNAVGIESAENGMKLDGDNLEVKDNILIKDLKVASGPQLAANLKLNYFHQKMWFADISINYFDNNYLGISPSRFSQGIVTGTRADGSKPALVYAEEVRDFMTAQESLVSKNIYERFMVDVSVGKLIYLKKGGAININLSVSNVTNNTGMKTGGYQTGRISTVNRVSPTPGQQETDIFVSSNVQKYPAKYYYAWGTNFFLNIGYRF